MNHSTKLVSNEKWEKGQGQPRLSNMSEILLVYKEKIMFFIPKKMYSLTKTLLSAHSKHIVLGVSYIFHHDGQAISMTVALARQ